ETIDGHKLTANQAKAWHAAVVDRGGQVNAQQLGWDDFLWKHRPTKRAEGHLFKLRDQVLGISLVLGNAARYPYWQNEGTVRQSGCTLLRDMAGECYALAHMIRELAAIMEAEDSTKLQDWVKLDETLERIERHFGSAWPRPDGVAS